METFSASAFIAILALSMSIGFFSPSARAEDRSFLIDLTTKNVTELDASVISANGINNTGQVVGEFETAGGSRHAFMTGPHGVGTTDLGILPSDFGDIASYASNIIPRLTSSANAINDKGQVVGSSDVIDNPRVEGGGVPAWDVVGIAFVTGQNGVGMMPVGSSYSFGDAINNRGEFVEFSEAPPRAPIAGSSYIQDANGHSHSLDWLSNDDSSYARQYDTTVANAINESGQVAGYSYIDHSEYNVYYHAIITGPDGVGITDLGTLGGFNSFATGINEAGQVTGRSDTAGGNTHAFITGPNGVGMTDLGTLGGTDSSATAINDSGRVVGYSEIAGGDPHAFVTGPNGIGMLDLNGLVHTHGFILTNATAINNAGEILAQGVSGVSVVSEPASSMLMPVGLMLLALIGMRRRA